MEYFFSKEGKKEGLEEGEQKKALEIARQLKQMKLSVTEIAQITGLSEEDIKGL